MAMTLAELSKQIGVDLVKDFDPEDLETVEGSYDFKLFTRDHGGNGTVVKAYEQVVDGQDEPDFIIEGIASSTVKDLHGDIMLPSAIIDMEKAANNNLTIYLNHKYQVPEDIAGSCRDAKVTSSAVDESGAPIYDLTFKNRVDKTNPRAVQTFKSLKGGTKLGMSIGANIPEGGAIRNKKTGQLLIAHVDLLETSIVAIPANPRSWIENAARAIKSGVRADKANEQIVATVETVVSTNAAPVTEVSILRESDGTGVEMKGIEAPADGTMVTLDTTEEPSETLSTTDTDPSQEAPQSGPENDGSATETVLASATDVLDRTADPAVTEGLLPLLLEAHNALAEVTDRLIDEQKARTDLETEKGILTRERDQAKETSVKVVTEVASLIEQLGRLPVGQRASFKRITEDFEDLTNVYPEEFVRQLRSIKRDHAE